MTGHVSGIAAWDGEKLRLVDPAIFNAGMRRLKPGNGETFVIRVEREAEAYTYGQIKFYWGHVVQPFCEWTGYHKHEAHAMLKAECMPDGKTSITELSREELKDYTEAAEQTAREWSPEAFAIMEPAVGGLH